MSKVSLKKLNLKKLNFKKLSFKLFQNLPKEEKRITLSTIFTLSRIFLTPFIVAAMITHHWGIAFFLFLIAAATDIIDGNVARWRNEQTFLGACLDPIADKVLLISCFFTLAFVQSPLFAIPLWFVVLVLLKDSIIICGSLAIFLCKGHLEVRPTILGKITTFVQTWFIIWLFACYFFNWLPIKIYYTMLGIMLVLVVATLIQYIVLGFWQWRIFSK